MAIVVTSLVTYAAGGYFIFCANAAKTANRDRMQIPLSPAPYISSHEEIMPTLLHIAHRETWTAAAPEGNYRPESLVEEGFIHCSLPIQVVPVANAMYRGLPDLVLLVIDPAKVPAEIRFEDCYQSGQEFPHIYGPLPVAAVDQVLAFEPGPDGRFTLPADFDRSD